MAGRWGDSASSRPALAWSLRPSRPGRCPLTRPFTLALLGCLFLTAAAPAQEPRPGPWEYRAVKFGPDEKAATTALNLLAADGWEYVGLLPGDLVAFRRPVLSPEEIAVTKELSKLQGTWTLVSYQAEG